MIKRAFCSLPLLLGTVLLTSCSPVASVNASWATQMIQDGGVVGVSSTSQTVTAYIPLNDNFYQTVTHGCDIPMTPTSEYFVVAVPETVDDLGSLRFGVEHCEIYLPLDSLEALLNATIAASQVVSLNEGEQLVLVYRAPGDWVLTPYESVSRPVYNQPMPFEAMTAFYAALGDVDLHGAVTLSTHDIKVVLPLDPAFRETTGEALQLVAQHPEGVRSLTTDTQGDILIGVEPDAPLLQVETPIRVEVVK